MPRIANMLKFILHLTALATSAYGSTNVQKCTSSSAPLPTSTTIVGCVDPPCQLPQLQDSITHIVFDAPHNIQTMKTLATAYFFGIAIPYDLGEKANTCNYLTNTQCPVSSGTTVNYTLSMFIEAFFPVGISVTIEYRVVDEKGDAVICVRVPVQIVEARNKAIEG